MSFSLYVCFCLYYLMFSIPHLPAKSFPSVFVRLPPRDPLFPHNCPDLPSLQLTLHPPLPLGCPSPPCCSKLVSPLVLLFSQTGPSSVACKPPGRSQTLLYPLSTCCPMVALSVLNGSSRRSGREAGTGMGPFANPTSAFPPTAWLCLSK